jgi:hypothetical protein
MNTSTEIDICTVVWLLSRKRNLRLSSNPNSHNATHKISEKEKHISIYLLTTYLDGVNLCITHTHTHVANISHVDSQVFPVKFMYASAMFITMLYAPPNLSCSSKYWRSWTLNHNRWRRSWNICIHHPLIFGIVFLNGGSAVRQKRETKQKVISFTLIDADLTAWGKQKLVFPIS